LQKGNPNIRVAGSFAIGFLVGISSSIANQSIVVIAGILTIVAGAASMALGNYLGVKSQKEHYEAMERVERWEMKHKPDVEREEIREIYTNMGFDRQSVETLTKKVTSDNELWLKVMMRDELGLSEESNERPMLAGIIMGAFFLMGGVPPLLPYIFVTPLSRALIMSVIISLIIMSFIGVIRWVLNKGSLSSKVSETVMIGIIAAGVGFIAGEIIRFLGYSV
jgi:vacuolar iron transporter family protein